jgi:phage terminase small subunit
MPKGHYKRPKLRNYPQKLTTEKSQKFVEYITKENTETYFNPIKSLIAAGYSQKQNAYYTIGRLLCNNNILNGLQTALHKNTVLTEIKGITAKERIWNELEAALIECKPREIELNGEIVRLPGDMTNRLRVIELMGKFHQLWSDKVTISVESYEKMTSEHLAELRELSKLRLLGNGPITEALLNAPRLIESGDNSGPDNQGGIDSTLLQCPSMPFTEQESIQDAVGDDDNADHNCSDIDKCSNDKDLTIQ